MQRNKKFAKDKIYRRKINMSLLLKLWAAVAITCAGTGQKTCQAHAQTLSNAVSCIAHPIDCATGMQVYFGLNPVAQAIETGLKQSFVEIGRQWNAIPTPQDDYTEPEL